MSNRIFILPLVAVLLTMSLFPVAQPARGAGAAVLTTDNIYGNSQQNFTVDGELFFGLYTGVQENANIVLINTTSGSTVSSISITTSTSGYYYSWISSTFEYFDLSYLQPGSYDIQALVGGSTAASSTLHIYYPVYTSHVTTKLSNYITGNSYYLYNGTVYATVFTEDQFGNPVSGLTSAGITLSAYSSSYGGPQYRISSLSPSNYGLSDFSFVPSSFSASTGTYNLTVYYQGRIPGSSQRNPELGQGVYYLLQPEVYLSPVSPDFTYGQGTRLDIQAYLYPFSGYLNISMVSFSTGQAVIYMHDQHTASYYWNGSLNVSYSIPDGSYFINISDALNSYLFYSQLIQLKALQIEAYPSQSSYLPGQPATIYYTVTNTSDNSPAHNATVTYVMNYTTTTGKQSESGTVSGGVMDILIPPSAMVPSVVTLYMEAAAGYGHNASLSLPLYVGSLSLTLTSFQSSYVPGQPVGITLSAIVNSFHFVQESPVQGAVVYANVSVNGINVASLASGTLTTGNMGTASYAFYLPPNATSGTYTIEGVAHAYGWTASGELNVSVLRPSSTYSLEIVPGSAFYFSGEEFTAAWWLLLNGSPVPGASSTYSASISGLVLSAASNTNGTIAFRIPSGLSGYMELQVSAASLNGSASSTIVVEVESALLSVNPSSSFYSPSTTLLIRYTVMGSGFTAPVFYYVIRNSNSNIVLTGTTSKDSFAFRVPSLPSPSYTITVTASNRSSGGYVSGSATVNELNGIQLIFSLSQPQYVPDIYLPGSTVTVHYSIRALGTSQLSPVYVIYVLIQGIQSSMKQVTVHSPSGSFAYTLPSEVSDGNYAMVVTAQAASSGQATQAVQTVSISSLEPFWDYNLLSGISLGSVLLAVVILASIAFSILAYTGRKFHRSSGMRGGEDENGGGRSGDNGGSTPP